MRQPNADLRPHVDVLYLEASEVSQVFPSHDAAEERTEGKRHEESSKLSIIHVAFALGSLGGITSGGIAPGCHGLPLPMSLLLTSQHHR
jgi:hypothetical protein